VFIVYGVSADQSIGKLFMAGVIPWLMIGGMMMLATYILATKRVFKSFKYFRQTSHLFSFKPTSFS
jgi:C4-dicarboxylate transporter DctM subunit